MGAVRWPKEGNPLYPLPPDYHRLGAEGQRLARLNALRLQETPEDLVNAWAFFRSYYLQPPEARWYKRWKPSPAAHYLMIQDLGTYSFSTYLAPRAFSKSTLMQEAAMLLMLTHQDYSVVLVLATGKKIRKAMRRIMQQFERNPRIQEDFVPEWGEPLRPPRGVRPWGVDLIELPNGSMLEGLSAQGALRGDRPDLLILDDPEYDEDEGTDITRLMEDFENLLFATILPMLEEGCPLFWIGTALPRSYIWHVVTGSDPRFQHINRKRLTIEAPDGTPIWPEKWDRQTIADLRMRYGESKFQQEYMNNPTAGSDRIFVLHPYLHFYSVEGTPEKELDPFQSRAIIRWRERTGGTDDKYALVERPFGEWARELYRIACVDFIRKPSQTSDYACVQVMGFDRNDTLWLLDSYLDRVRTNTLIQIVWGLCQKWQLRVIGAEAESVQAEMADQMATLIGQWSEGRGVIPRVIPIKYAKRSLHNTDAPTQISKPERIAGLEWRFTSFRIRFPEHRRTEPAIATLLHQVENFTLDLGLLRFDDALDTLAMQQYVVHRPGSARRREPTVHRPLEALKEGRLLDELGLPYVFRLDPSELTLDLYKQVQKKRREVEPEEEDHKEVIAWPPKSQLAISMFHR